MATQKFNTILKVKLTRRWGLLSLCLMLLLLSLSLMLLLAMVLLLLMMLLLGRGLRLRHRHRSRHLLLLLLLLLLLRRLMLLSGSVWAVPNARLLLVSHSSRLLLVSLLLMLCFLSSSIRKLLLVGRHVVGGGLSVAIRLVTVSVAVLSHGAGKGGVFQITRTKFA